MTDKELKKLNRRQLLELLMLQTKRTEELEEKVVDAERRLADMTRRLSEKQASVTDMGTMAEAALKLNGVFEAADAAARQYLENVKDCDSRCEQMLEQTRRRCEEMEQRAEARVAALRAQVQRISREWDT